MRYSRPRRMHARHTRAQAARTAAPLLAVLALATCHDAPTGPGRITPRHELVFVSDAPPGDTSVRLTTLAGTDSTIRLALRLPRAVAVTALVYELQVAGAGATLVSLVPGDLFDGDTALVAERVAGDGGRWLGVVSLGSYEGGRVGPGTLAIADFRRTSAVPFTVTVRFDGTSTVLYGDGGVETTEPVVGGSLVYRVVPPLLAKGAPAFVGDTAMR